MASAIYRCCAKSFFILLTMLCHMVFADIASASETKYFGLYGAWALENMDDALAITKNNGFNLVVSGPNKAYLDKMQSVGVKALIAFDVKSTDYQNPSTWQQLLNRIRNNINSIKHHPAVFAWYLIDEPDIQNFSVEKVRELTDMVRSVDSSKPLYTVMVKPDKWEKYLPYFDIIAEDKYIDKSSNTPEVVRESLRQLKSDLRKNQLNKRVWAVLGALDLIHKSKLSTYHKPTPKEFEEMIRIACEEQVEGIMVYTLAFKNNTVYKDWNLIKDDPLLWKAVKKVPSCNVSGSNK